MDIRFELGNTVMICGPSKAGKTMWVINLIRNRNLLFKELFNKIYWFYGAWQDGYENLTAMNIIMKQGTIEDNSDEAIESKSMVVLDDLVMETENSRAVTALFTKQVHHKHLFLVYITQNFYHQSREARMRHLNSHYIVFFKNPRDKTQASILARQMFPGRSCKAFAEMFEKVTTKPHSYLMIDLGQNSPTEIRLRTNIFPHEYPPIVYK
jgi:hypothetical protein